MTIIRCIFMLLLCVCSICATNSFANTCKTGVPPHYSIEGGGVLYDFYGAKIRVDADTETFKAIPLPPHGLGPCESGREQIYGKDNHRVFYEGKVIAGAQPASFQPLAEYQYAKDAAAVFYRGKPLADADPATFKILEWPDETTAGQPGRVYLQRPRGERFSVYAIDSRHVWDQGRLVPGLDAATFTLLPMNYAKDKNGVYQNGRLVPSLDPKPPIGPQSR